MTHTRTWILRKDWADKLVRALRWRHWTVTWKRTTGWGKVYDEGARAITTDAPETVVQLLLAGIELAATWDGGHNRTVNR